MRYLFVAMLFVLTTATVQAAEPTFQLGFKALAEQIPDVVGVPLENEHWGANGDSLQKTSKGLMVWRKLDNFTCFTDGAISWVSGPYGVQSRPNGERFSWEGDYEVWRVEKAIKNTLNSTISQQIRRAEKFETSESLVVVHWLDTNWGKGILQNHQYRAISGIADWLVANSKLRPTIVIRSTSALSAGNYLESSTSGTLLDSIGKRQAGQSEWLGQAKFTVVGQLY